MVLSTESRLTVFKTHTLSAILLLLPQIFFWVLISKESSKTLFLGKKFRVPRYRKKVENANCSLECKCIVGMWLWIKELPRAKLTCQSGPKTTRQGESLNDGLLLSIGRNILSLILNSHKVSMTGHCLLYILP